ncbi:acyl-CoA dehydrogenase family protein [Martelella alba]
MQTAIAGGERTAIAPVEDAEAIIARAAEIGRVELQPLVHSIDAEGVYPEAVMRALGAAGAFRAHAPLAPDAAFDLKTSIGAMSAIGEYCLSTAFCMWCQDALGWYIANSDNAALKAELGEKVASGQILGGTGLSNPMKAIFGIEKIKLAGKRVEGGFEVTGRLPWVSNLGDDHFFGMIFELPEEDGRLVMAVADCADERIKLVEGTEFTALDGTRTFGLQLRKAFIPAARVIADPLGPYIQRIRAGFILLQAGMAFGMIRSCIDLMEQAGQTLSHVNCHLPDQPEDFRQQLAALEAEVSALCETPFDTSTDYFIRVLEARLQAGDAAVAAAHNAMLHCGARGYVKNGAAQRRLREAYFVAIVTPATKQLRKMLADLKAA